MPGIYPDLWYIKIRMIKSQLTRKRPESARKAMTRGSGSGWLSCGLSGRVAKTQHRGNDRLLGGYFNLFDAFGLSSSRERACGGGWEGQ
jgi:hypothetical protein